MTRSAGSPLPFAGSIHATVISVQPVSIHGDLYADLTLVPLGGESDPHGTAIAVRVPTHALPDGAGGPMPTPGRKVSVSFLMQQVTGVSYLV